eukprot:XP_011431662.1 PREDICTED: structural maintenance of chromosomes flexible hinge domain-containing protein 1 [Crassostrea gigas]
MVIENGTAPVFHVEVQDMSGNITTDKNLTVTCKFPGLPTDLMYLLDCSASGCGNITGDPVLLKKVKDNHKLKALFEVPNKKDVSAVERTLVVTPSNSISHIEVKQEENKKQRILKQGESIMGKAGDVISGLTLVLYDEAGRAVTIDEKIFPKIKVNWIAKLNQEMVLSGNLPPIKVPASVSDLKYCQVAIHDKSNVEFSFTVKFRDQHGNPSGTGYSGKVKVEICGPDDVTEVPCFVGGSKTLDIALNNGTCVLNNLTIQENAPGLDCQEYRLRCEVLCSLIPKNKSIPALEIPFLFYNDAKKQSQMSQLSKQRDNLQKVINTYHSLFDTTDLLTKELQTSVKEALQEEDQIKEELRKLRVSMHQLTSIENVEKMIEAKTLEKERCLQMKRRSCGLPQLSGNPEVIGKIGHLAEIADPDIARVLSWHMSSDIDCVVTKTTKSAKDVYKQTNGKQQVLPLDSIFKKTLPDWNKPLPHTKYRTGWRPPGNPSYARDFLEFPQHKQECQTVFGMLLGDTLILDDLDSANAYRQEIVKFTHCPTILTREGDRIRSNGKFGGLMNKAVPIEKLKGAVFGEPLNPQYKEAESIVETLQRFKVAMQKTSKAKEELKDQSSYIELPEMKSKRKECQDAEKQLIEVEKKLGMTSSRSRTPQVNTTPPQATPSKRARLSSQTPVNGAETTPTPSPQFTPTRQSKRLASMTPTMEDGRKKLRKT